ncbi:hypothetical protein MUK42_15145 [Musa troglodytarum]|uniref:Uncharacterized protein n=1 Tax=Musa troglodytarum TaxID=320322 RepID=A0A9E7JQX8_9LILI|nr:hypothetical protein MUK42_15145 [Musa troglodytarum]
MERDMHTMAQGGGLAYKLGSAITHLRLPPVLYEEGALPPCRKVWVLDQSQELLQQHRNIHDSDLPLPSTMLVKRFTFIQFIKSL